MGRADRGGLRALALTQNSRVVALILPETGGQLKEA